MCAVTLSQWAFWFCVVFGITQWLCVFTVKRMVWGKELLTSYLYVIPNACEKQKKREARKGTHCAMSRSDYGEIVSLESLSGTIRSYDSDILVSAILITPMMWGTNIFRPQKKKESKRICHWQASFTVFSCMDTSQTWMRIHCESQKVKFSSSAHALLKQALVHKLSLAKRKE